MTIHIGFVIFDGLTQLDFTGPLQVLHRLPGAQIHIAACSMEPVMSDCGLGLLPTTSFTDCTALDVVCIPGGIGVGAAITNAELITFVHKQGKQAHYITSVCSGAFVLGVAGLLKGRKATTHWAYHDLLSCVGAIPTKGRVVRDGPIMTGGGVTAGIDFALTLAAELAGQEAAQTIQLSMEYNPEPPLQSGTPENAPAAIHANLRAFYAPFVADFEKDLKTVLARR